MKIEVKNLEKKFKQNVIITNINVELVSGNIYGLIGRNGSGKSLFLKMLCGFYIPTSGEILFDGENLSDLKLFPPNTGALIEKPTFLPDLTGLENLKLLANINKKISTDEIIKFMKRINLDKEINKKYSKYSLGTKQKLGIVQAIMEKPDLIILDEPLNGIDKETAKVIREILIEEKQKGKLIIIASHIKEDIEMLSDIVYEFDAGNMSLVSDNKKIQN